MKTQVIGQTRSHYKILEKLGEGGMGVVYKAQDTKLKRVVALKFLPHHINVTTEEETRLLQEAQAAATLNHPNICTIHDIKEHEGPASAGGQQFIVMECVDGMTLRKKILASPLRPEDAIAYALQIGDALHEAHNKGIVHRDIKADNIMVNAKNQVKVMDFGLAKLKGSLKLTKASSTIGTLAYMAPEQIQGNEVDGRSDIFSFGVLLFEMLTSRMPFRGDHDAAIMYSILNEESDTVQKYRQDVSPELDRIIHRALEKDPADRYQHVDDMVSELRKLQKSSTRVVRPDLPAQTATVQTSQVPTGSRKKSTMAMWITAAVVVVLAVAGWLLFLNKPAQHISSIAVLPFANVGADPDAEYLSDGITENLINTLSQLSNLTVMSRSSVFHYKGKGIDPQKAGNELGVQAVLVGRVTQRGEGLVISTELINVSNNSHIWGSQYNRKLADIITVQEEISREISRTLSIKLGGDDERSLSKRPTDNTAAYQLYLKGRYHWNKRKAEEFQKAIEYFNKAIDEDPAYALAYAGLASTYVLTPEYSGKPSIEYLQKAEATAKKASELDPTLAEPHAALGLMKYLYYWEWKHSEEELRRALELDSGYPTAHHWLSICLRMQGRFEESLSEIGRAQELDPLSLIININVGDALSFLGRTGEAADQYRKVIDLDPNFVGAHRNLGALLSRQGKFEEAIGELQKARELVGENSPIALESLGFTYAKAGREKEATGCLNRLLNFTQQGYSLGVQIATVYAGLGENDKALEWLEKGYQQNNHLLGYLKVSHVWNGLHSDQRYHALLRRMGLEQ